PEPSRKTNSSSLSPACSRNCLTAAAPPSNDPPGPASLPVRRKASSAWRFWLVLLMMRTSSLNGTDTCSARTSPTAGSVVGLGAEGGCSAAATQQGWRGLPGGEAGEGGWS